MRLLIISALLTCFAFASNAQTPDCQKFRSGKFYYPTLPGKISWRKDSIQESYNNGQLEMMWSVKWLSECEYELTCTKVLVDHPYPIKKGDRIVATIVKTEGDCFTTTLVVYNAENPQGQAVPGGDMCIRRE
jgi:hypothetical protein